MLNVSCLCKLHIDDSNITEEVVDDIAAVIWNNYHPHIQLTHMHGGSNKCIRLYAEQTRKVAAE